MRSLVVIGNLDGVHKGHVALLRSALSLAKERGLRTKLLTFDPHPMSVLGGSPPPLLTRPSVKRELVHLVSPEIELIEQLFDVTYAAQTPSDFAERLRCDFEAEVVFVGQNFRFGKGRAGDRRDLDSLGVRLGFEAKTLPLVGDEKGPFSSTRARGAIASGDMASAEEVLGRPHLFSGEVVRGKELGRTIGFPTANLDGIIEVIPPFGVYAVRTYVESVTGVDLLAEGAMSIGINPTTDRTSHTKVEINLFDFAGDLYGKKLRVEVIERLRGEEKFESLDALTKQIAMDVGRAKEILRAPA